MLEKAWGWGIIISPLLCLGLSQLDDNTGQGVDGWQVPFVVAGLLVWLPAMCGATFTAMGLVACRRTFLQQGLKAGWRATQRWSFNVGGIDPLFFACVVTMGPVGLVVYDEVRK